MQKLIGVDNIFEEDQSMSLYRAKKNALVFDQIAITLLDETKKILSDSGKNKDLKSVFVDEIEFLQKEKIIIDPEELRDGKKISLTKHGDKHDEVLKLMKEAKEAFGNFPSFENSSKIADWWVSFNHNRQRLDALALQILLTDDFVIPLIPEIGTISSVATTKHQAYQLVINKLPSPTLDVPWEQIIEFRNDSDSKRKFLALRTWISKVSRSGIPLNEIEEELEHLLSDYEHHFKLHKMKYERGTIQTIVMGVAEVIENIATLKFSKAAELPFNLFQKEVELMEGEAKLPGQEIAYIFKAGQTFNK